MKTWKMCRDSAVYGVLLDVTAADPKKATGTKSTSARKKTVRRCHSQAGKPLTPVQVEDGQQHIKAKLLGELDTITTAMLEKAKKGGTAPLRLLWDLGKLNQDATAKPKEREITLSDLLTKELREKAAKRKATSLRK